MHITKEVSYLKTFQITHILIATTVKKITKPTEVDVRCLSAEVTLLNSLQCIFTVL